MGINNLEGRDHDESVDYGSEVTACAAAVLVLVEAAGEGFAAGANADLGSIEVLSARLRESASKAHVDKA